MYFWRSLAQAPAAQPMKAEAEGWRVTNLEAQDTALALGVQHLETNNLLKRGVNLTQNEFLEGNQKLLVVIQYTVLTKKGEMLNYFSVFK